MWTISILPAFLFLILGICSSTNADEKEDFQKKAMKKTKEDLDDVPKQVTFDQQGILVIDGTVGGTSDPIPVDRKPLIPKCFYKPYYLFTVCPKNKKKFQMATAKDDCSEGIIFCYDSQLNKNKVREQFVLPSVENGIKEKCKEFSGFKLALHKKPVTTEANSKDEPTYKGYLEVDTTFTKEPYFFALADNGCLDLALGSEQGILAGVRSAENDNNWIEPEQILHQNKRMGVYYENYTVFWEAFNSLPDTDYNNRFFDVPHLKLLYLDFRAYLYAPQMMMAIVPEPDNTCNMRVKIRSNVLETCRSEFKQKNFALRALNDSNAKTEYALTIESGTDEWKTTGSKRGKSNAKSESTETGGSTIDETSQTTGLQRERESINRNSDTHTETSGTESTSEKGAEAFAQGCAEASGGGGNVQACIDAKAGASKIDSSGSSEMFQKFNSREGRESHSETTSMTTMSIIETFHRNTQTSINTQKSQTFNSQSVGIQKRTVFKWIVKVPPGKVMTPMQMTTNCDGEKVQIPQLKFVITEEDEDPPAPDYEEGSTLEVK